VCKPHALVSIVNLFAIACAGGKNWINTGGNHQIKKEEREMLLFVSHSHKDRGIASLIKSELNDFGVDVFVAHEDINPTEEWQEAILEKLEQCDALLLLLTDSFKNSFWTDQETGFAMALKKLLIPVKIDIEPYGFISKYQALSWGDDSTDNIRRLIELLIDKQLISIDALIQSFAKSPHYDTADTRIGFLMKATTTFSQEQINSIAKSAIENGQINGAWATKKQLRQVFSNHRSMIEPEFLDQLKSLGLIQD
jgi:hypothetical protein